MTPTSPVSERDSTHDPAKACRARAAQLLGCAPEPASFDTRLFAALVAAREVRGEMALLGLSYGQLEALYLRHFNAALGPCRSVTIRSAEHASFVGSLRALLLAQTSPRVSPEDAACVAAIVAHACLRPDHLWRDLGLGGRDEVSAMLERYFPGLVARNVDGIRWKKFLARELARAMGTEPRPAPGCPGCEDFGFCFPG